MRIRGKPFSNGELDGRRRGVVRPYSAEDVDRLAGSVRVEHTLAKLGAERLWSLLSENEPVTALGALTGNQAVQAVKGGLNAIYVSGWQVAADANAGGEMYPDQSLYPVNSVPLLVKRINNAFTRADQIDRIEGKSDTYWFAPIIADAEAGFGGALNVFELMKAMIEAGAAGVHLEDQLRFGKKMRPHGRQSADSNANSYSSSYRSASCVQRDGRLHDHHRSNRR